MASTPITAVVADQPVVIEWGNAVANELNNECIKRDGTRVMTGDLTLRNADPTADNHAARKKYVDTLTTGKLNLTGGTMTGALLLDSPQSSNAAAAVRYDWLSSQVGLRVSTAGDTMTGDLLVGAGGGVGTSGCRIDTTGRADYTVTANLSNLALNKIGSGDVSGGAYIHFQTGTNGGSTASTKSSITRNAADNGIAISNCNTTAPSDYRLKDDLGPVAGGLQRILDLIPRHLRWKQGDDPDFDGFFAHEVTPVAPYCVIGEKDAVFPPDSETNPGEINAQQLDLAGLVPLLVAGIQELAARVVALEGA